MRRKEFCRAECLRPNRFRARALLSLILAVVFTFQGFLVNTHIHLSVLPFDGFPMTPSATTAGLHADGHGTEAPDTDDPCVLCMAAALIGTYSLPSAVVLQLPAEFLPLERPHCVHRHAIPAQHRAWQSRAPPIA